MVLAVSGLYLAGVVIVLAVMFLLYLFRREDEQDGKDSDAGGPRR